MTDHLRFSQGIIGMLSSVSAGGWIAGGLIYRFLLRGMATRALLNLSILAARWRRWRSSAWSMKPARSRCISSTASPA